MDLNHPILDSLILVWVLAFPMLSKQHLLIVVCLHLFFHGFSANNGAIAITLNPNASVLTTMEFPSFNSVSSSSDSDCKFHQIPSQDEQFKVKPSVVLNMKHRSHGNPQDCVVESTAKDLNRIQTLHTRITEKKNQNSVSRLKKDSSPIPPPSAAGQLTATLESGVSLGSGEYFMDVFIGTPPKHFSLILDTGSDLNWIQCVPCYDCFEQTGPFYDPKESTSYKNVGCNDGRCSLVSAPDPPLPCRGDDQGCPYYYWYGDSSNTTGDLALEKFTVNLTGPNGKSEFKEVDNVIFGCGHWNRGLFHGAAGLLGLGRGPLSFSSQLQSLYGHSFSYCLVDRDSNSSVSSKLIFGENGDLMKEPGVNFTSFVVSGKENPVDTFYYVDIESFVVGGYVVDVPKETWSLSSDGGGGTIIDSGTTLSYFADPAYKMIKDAFVKKVKYPVIKDFPILDPCYNVSGVESVELPSFGIVFGDGAEWNFPVENYFIQIEPNEVVCLAILGTPRSGLSIIGNYQQQNFHILYDTNKSRLGFVPRKCADL